MKKNMYESTVILNAGLDDESIETLIKKIRDFIENGGGTIIDLERFGRRRLAYMIKKHRIGFYVIYRFEAPADLIKGLNRLYRLDESVVRQLTLVLDKNGIEYFHDLRTNAAEAVLASERIAALPSEKKPDSTGTPPVERKLEAPAAPADSTEKLPVTDTADDKK